MLRPLNSRSSRNPDRRISSGSGVVGPRNQLCHPPPKPVRQREPALMRSGLCLPAPAPLGRSDDIECVALFYEQPRVAASKPGHGLALDGPRETASRGAGRTLSEVTGRGPCCVGLPGAMGTLGLRKASPRAAGFTRRCAAPPSVRPEKNRCCARPSLYCVKLGRASHVIPVPASTFRWAHRHRLRTSHTADNRFP